MKLKTVPIDTTPWTEAWTVCKTLKVGKPISDGLRDRRLEEVYIRLWNLRSLYTQ